VQAIDPRLAALLEPTLGATFAPTLISAGEKINVIPARAEFAVDCRLPPGLGITVAERRAQELLGDADGFELEFGEEIIGNRSPVASPLMDAIAAWLREAEPEAEAVPTMMPAFTDSRWFRVAFPDCVAYGFFPQRHQDLYASWPLMHAADERLDVRDIGFATEFFADLPRRLLT
jgi:acetylornithine deacetylase/succinyl-diaminopimelate desuccinylase-like protein